MQQAQNKCPQWQLILCIPFQTKTAQHWFFPKHKGMFLRRRTIAYTKTVGFWVEKPNLQGTFKNFFYRWNKTGGAIQNSRGGKKIDGDNMFLELWVL
jgi:hypothetical protein